MKKQCSRCKIYKSLDDFWLDAIRSFGRQSWCKKCKDENQREMRRTPEGRKRRNLNNKRYCQTAKGRLAKYKSNVKYVATHIKEIKARAAVNRAVRTKKIPKPSNRMCSNCDKPAIEYHHHSYEKIYWLDVVPVCKSCHIILDSRQD